MLPQHFVNLTDLIQQIVSIAAITVYDNKFINLPNPKPMKLSCFVLHTHPQMDTLVSYIKKHPALELISVEYNIKKVSRCLFAPNFRPDLTFIDRATFAKHYRQIYTLLKVSGDITMTGQEPTPGVLSMANAKYYLSYDGNYASFSAWAKSVKKSYEYSLLLSPDFTHSYSFMSGQKKAEIIVVSKDEIVVVWMRNGICHVGLENKTLICSNTMSELYTLFRHDHFIQASEEVIVNTNHIEGQLLDILRLQNGMNILLGFKFRQNYFYKMKPEMWLHTEREIKWWEDFFNSADEGHNGKLRKNTLKTFLTEPR